MLSAVVVNLKFLQANLLIHLVVKCSLGLSLIPELIIDTHFIERDRLPRLAEAVSIYPNRIGVGISENTAIIIKNDKIRVIGHGSVTVFNSDNLKVLSPGDRYNINRV